jgi:hypothetical protein
MVFFTTMFTTADVNIHALIVKYGIDIQLVRPEMTKTANLFLLHFDKWDRVVALPRQHGSHQKSGGELGCSRRVSSKHGFLLCGNYILKYW